MALITTDSREHYRDYSNPHPHFGTAPQALLDGLAHLPSVQVHVLSCAQQKMKSPDKLAENVWFHSLFVPKLGWLRTGYIGCVRAVRKALFHIRPDVAHGQGTERDCSMDAVLSGYPNVLTIHGNMRLVSKLNGARPFSFEWLAARFESFVLQRTDGVICITNYTKDAVESHARRTWVLPNAVDPTFFPLQRRPSLPPVVLCVAMVCARKNQNLFIRSLDKIAKDMRLRVVFLGGVDVRTPYGAEFRTLVDERPWCEFHGFTARAELKRWLSEASLVVLPSLEDNCPMIVLEAAAAGVPVVAARVGGVPDLIRDGITGLLCDPSSIVDMDRVVRKALQDRELAERMASQARLEASERFAPRRVAEQHLAIYREVLSTRS